MYHTPPTAHCTSTALYCNALKLHFASDRVAQNRARIDQIVKRHLCPKTVLGFQAVCSQSDGRAAAAFNLLYVFKTHWLQFMDIFCKN